MKYLKKIDIFGVFGDNQYNSMFGGFLTIVFAEFSISVIFLFGTDLYLRKNPKVIIDRIVPNDQLYMKYSLSNFPFFWNIFDDHNNVSNFTKILYPISNFYVYKYNTNLLELNDTKILPKELHIGNGK